MMKSLTFNNQCGILSVGENACGGVIMEKGQRMSRESVKKRLEKRIAMGDAMCPLTVMRLSRGMTQVELAERAGMNQAYIARIESGEREICKITMLSGKRIADALGCKMEELL